MAKTTILLAIALDYFTRYPNSEECHITSDKRVFHQKSTAESYNPKDTEITSYTRAEAVAEGKATAGSQKKATKIVVHNAFAEAGTPEAGTPEAGTPEAGTPEAGTPEAGTPEAGTPEAGTPEAGTPEAGTPETGTPEAGIPGEEKKEAQPITLEQFDPAVTEYSQALELFKSLGLKAESNKKAAIYPVLTQAKAAAAKKQ